MDDQAALELIDAHLDQQPLTQEQADALAQWLKEHPEHADRAFHRIFLHSFLRQRVQMGALPASGGLIESNLKTSGPAGQLIMLPIEADSESGQPERKPFRSRSWGLAAGLLLILIGTGAWGLSRWAVSQALSTVTAVYEGFDYPPTEPPAPLGDGRKWPTSGGMSGLAGGIGWEAPWEEQGPKVSVLVANMQANAWRATDMRKFGPLGYSDAQGDLLQSTGIQLRTAAGPLSNSVRRLKVSAFPDVLSASNRIGKDGSVLWLSFLAQSFDGRGSGNFAYLQLGTDAAGFRIGKLGVVPSGNWSAAGVLDGAELNARWTEISSGHAVLLVVRITFRPGGEQIDIWANPNLNREPSVTSAAMRLQVPAFEFDTISIASRYTTDFDEIRLGPSFRSVTPLQ